MLDLPLEARRRPPSLHCLDGFLDAKKHPCPIGRDEQIPVQLREPMHIPVAIKDLVLISAPGQREVRDAIVQVSPLEVQDPGELAILEQQVPGGKVAVHDQSLRAFHVDSTESLTGLSE